MKTKTLLAQFAAVILFSTLLSARPAFAQSLRFDGVNDFVNVPNSGSLTIVGRITVEAWVNRAAVGAQHSVVEKFGAAGSGQGGYDLRISAGDRVQFETRDDGGRAVTVTGATAIPANTWVHIAGTWDGANNRVFVNGVQDGIVANGRPPRAGNTALKIGARGNDNGTPMNGGIDDARIWNVARTAAQIAANSTNCLAGDEAGLVALWHMDEGTGLTTADATANHNNGTLVNAVAWNPVGAISCVPAGPSFDALEIFTAPAPVLAVPPVNFAGAVVNDTREFPTNLPPGSIASIVFPGATVLAINTAGAGQEWVLDIGSETVRVYTHAGTRIVNSPVVGSVVKMVGSRTIAPGPIVADVITLRTV
ncbi:MAG TPA: LamG domain-containing protein, partial [Verrucomicrobiae bacterium]